MSGIVGLFYRDGRPVGQEEVGKMVDILAHRGPNGADIWCQGPIGLGHRMLHTTPESLNEKLPFVNHAAGLAITADARLDNRDELISILGYDDRPAFEVSDSQLILAAYEKWGKCCPEHLLGAFAFAIWDTRHQQLFCARDHFGVKPFYYFLSKHLFVFATEIRALFCLEDVPNNLNKVRIGDYLISNFSNKKTTFFENISRLPPAFHLAISSADDQAKSYWSLDPSQELNLASNEAYADAFGELFTEAVRCRLRSAFPAGSLLSGGLDSSSITSVAGQLTGQDGSSHFATFSGIFEEVAACDERPFINAVLAQGNFDPHYVAGDQLNILDGIERILWHEEEPYNAHSLSLNWNLYRITAQNGVRILLDGHDGDTTVSHGFGYLRELANDGHWLKLAREMQARTNVYNDYNYWHLLWLYVRYYGLDPVILNTWPLKKAQRLGQKIWARIGFFQQNPEQSYQWHKLLNPEFVKESDLLERYRATKQSHPAFIQTERERHYRAIMHGVQPLGLEVLDKAAAAHSIEPRYPFWDKRLVEFCLALPPEQKLNQGWSRMILRRSMDGILPAAIQWRVDKTDFLPNFSRALMTVDQKFWDELLRDGSGQIEEFVDIGALNKEWNQSHLPDAAEEKIIRFRAFLLALWLRAGRINEIAPN